MTESNSGRKNQSNKLDATVLNDVLRSFVIATFVMGMADFSAETYQHPEKFCGTIFFEKRY